MNNNFIKYHIWPSIQPVIFETDLYDYPYTTSGTIFFVGYYGRVFAITARHVLFPLNPICLCPSNLSHKLLPLAGVFFIPENEDSYEFEDFAIIEINVRKALMDNELRSTQFINLEHVTENWIPYAQELEFFICGYPSQYSKVDFKCKNITTPRFMLKAHYIGPLQNSECVHTLRIFDTGGVDDFDGFSGSPIFAIIPNEPEPIKVFFCGMVIRGTSSSGLIHFIEKDILLTGICLKPAPYKVLLKTVVDIKSIE